MSICNGSEWTATNWGKKRLLAATTQYCIEELLVERGGYSSIHCHLNKVNVFHLLAGEMEILSYEPDSTLNIFSLGHGKPLLVREGVKHQFRCNREAAHIIEISTARIGCVCDLNDIIRDNIGGRNSL